MISFVGTKKTMVKINERTTGDLVILWMPLGDAWLVRLCYSEPKVWMEYILFGQLFFPKRKADLSHKRSNSEFRIQNSESFAKSRSVVIFSP